MEEDPTPGAVTWSGSIVIQARRLGSAVALRTIFGLARLLAPPLLIVFAIGAVVGAPAPVAGATRTWDGGSIVTQNWTDPLNWVGDVAPVAGDTVVFDATSIEPVTINASVTVQGVTVAAGYSGVITQAAGSTLTVTGGVADFIQAGGTFTGGTAAITVGDQFTLSGGTFTSTTGTLTVNGAFTMSGGSFGHNGGTVAFAASNVTIDVPTSLTLNNASFLSGTKTIAAGDTLDVVGTLNLAGGVVNTGTLAAQGAITVQAGFTGNSTATLLINGAADQTMTGFHTVGSGDLPAVVINKPSGSLTLGTSGTGILRTTDNWTYTAAPGGLVTTGSTLVFTGGTITGSHTLDGVQIRGGTVTIAAGTTLAVPGNLNLFSGALAQAAATGTLAAQGAITVQAGFTGNSTATLLINGAADQTMTGFHTVGSGDLPAVVINKPSGSLTLGTSGTGILRTTDNWTYTAAPGGLVTTGSTLVFTGGTITGSHTLDGVQIRGGTVTIAAGTTLAVPGNLNLFSGALAQAAATGTLAAQGAITVQAGFTGNSTATLLINGAADQTMTGFHTVGSGDLPAVVINKPSGSLTLGTSGTGILRTTDNWTYTAAPGGLVTTGSTLVFTGGTITGSHTLDGVQIRGGTVTIAAGTTLTAAGSLDLVTGALNGGTLAVEGDLFARAGFASSGTATVLINGTADQTFTGFHNSTTGSLPNITIDKPAGTLTVSGGLRTGRNWTYLTGGLVTTGSTLVFTGGTITGSHTLDGVQIRGGTVTIAAGTTLTAAGSLDLVTGALNGGTLAVEGDLFARAGFASSGTATVLINGTADQTFTGFHNSTTGSLPNITIDKPAGTLTVSGGLRTGRNWTYLTGGLVTTGSTLVFTGGTITGSHTLDGVQIRGGTVTIAAGTTLTAAGSLDLVTGALNGGTLAVEGDLFARAGFASSGTATVLINGTADQTFTGFHNSTTGSLPNITIDKPAGTLTVSGGLRTGRNWTYLTGGLVTTGSTLVFTGNLTISGTHALDIVELRSGNVTVAAGDTVSVNGLLTLTNGNLEGGTIAALGDINLLDTFDGETGTLLIAGTGVQTLTGSATPTTGDVANIVIDKPSGTLFLAGTIRLLTSSWTWVEGTVDAGTSLVVFDSGTTVNAPGMAFFDVQVTGGTATLLGGLDVDGALWVSGGTLALAGLSAAVAGDVTVDGSIAPGTGELVMDGAAAQVIGGTAVSIGLFDLTADNPAGVTLAIEVQVAGTLTLIGPLSFSGQTLGIANPIAGTPTNLSGDAASTLEVVGTGAGIVVPVSLPTLGNLLVDNPNGAALAASITIGQTLTLTDGILRSRPWVLTIDPAGSVVRTAGHVDGALQKTIPLGGGTVVYEIGDATTYAPVALTFGMVSGSGPITAMTTAGEHTSIGTSLIDPDLDVNRWWSIVDAGVVFDTVDVVFSWAPSDVDPGADPMAFVTGKWSPGWTLPVAGMLTPTSIMAYGLTSFSEFAVGELEEGDPLPDTAQTDPVPTAPLMVASLVTTLAGLLAMLIFRSAHGSRRRPARVAALSVATLYPSDVPVVEVAVLNSSRPDWEIDWQDLYR